MTVVNNTILVNRELVIDHCGNVWNEFMETIPEPHVELFEEGLAIIFRAFPESLVSTQIVELVVDEQLDAGMRSMALRKIIYDNIRDIINKMGVTLNNDYLELDHLKLLCEIADFFFVAPLIEDSLSTIYPQLQATDSHPKYRFINAFTKAMRDEEEPDISELECVIDDVSEVTLNAISDSLTGQDNQDVPPDAIIKRVVGAKALLDGSLGYQHVRNGGGLGSPVETYLNFFAPELNKLLNQDTLDSFLEYGRDVISLHLISEINDDRIKETLLRYFEGRVDDLTAQIRIESMVKALNLPNGS
jgi:hypothetical protein